MDKHFLKLFLDKTEFPCEAQAALFDCFDKADNAMFCEALDFFFESGFDIVKTEEKLSPIAEQSGISIYTVWLLLLILAAKRVKPLYDQYGEGDGLFYDTFCDLRYKAHECMEMHGVWGNFVAFWYPIFYRGSIVKLGRLEYEKNSYYFDKDYCLGDITIKHGDPVLSMHIPSSDEPFDSKARLDSYKTAHRLFCKKGEPLICICDSWLLYPEYKDVFGKGNVLDFMNEFDTVASKQTEFNDAWRVFGRLHDAPPETLPEKTSMQRAFKQRIIEGGSFGSGQCVLIFDGEKIVTKR